LHDYLLNNVKNLDELHLLQKYIFYELLTIKNPFGWDTEFKLFKNYFINFPHTNTTNTSTSSPTQSSSTQSSSTLKLQQEITEALIALKYPKNMYKYLFLININWILTRFLF